MVQIDSIPKFKCSFDHIINGVPANTAVYKQFVIENLVVLGSFGLAIPKHLAPLIIPIDIYTDVMQLANRPFLIPDFKRLIVTSAAELPLELADTVTEKNRLDNEVDDMAYATKPLFLLIDIKELRQRLDTSVIVASVIHHEAAKLRPNGIPVNNLLNAAGNVFS